MIAKDEEGFLKGCLDSVKDIVDEIIIGIDSRSKDRTREIAEKAGAEVFGFDWKEDFSAARNKTLEKATSNWILVLDADELLDEAGRAELQKLINTKEHCLKDIIGFKLDQRTYQLKEGVEPVKTTDETEILKVYNGHESSMLVRLFKNNPKIRFRNKVHELVEHSIRDAGGEILDTGVVVHHFSHMKKGTLEGKTDNYMDLMWKQLEREPENPRYNRQVALAFLERGRKDLAHKYLARALKFKPEYPGLLADMAKLHVEMGNKTQAIKFFNAAIATNKKDVSSLNNLAVLYLDMGRLDIARKLLDKALIQEPMNKAVLSNYEKLKKMRDAGKEDKRQEK
jgi:glycosyltransferase involved in cell wall biosynthesis